VQPSASDHWQIAAADFDVRRSLWSWHTTLGYTHRSASDKEDATYGTQQILSGYYGLEGLPAQPFLWVGDRSLSQWTLESRVALQPVAAWSAVFGVYSTQADSRYETPPTYATGLQSASQQPNAVGAWPNDLLWSITVPATQRDLSAFAEVDFHVTPKWMISAGLRVYRLSQRIDNLVDGYLNFGPTPSNAQRNHESGTSPKLAFTYLPREGVSVWTSAAKGFRAGGAQASLPFCTLPGLSDYDITHLKSDSLWSYEVGTRVERQSVNISAAVYRIDWKNFQQLIALPCGAFVSINGGRARSRGMELELDLYPAAHWHIRANAGYQDTRVSDPGNLSWSGVSTGNRLAGIPRWTGSLSADHEWWLAGGRSIFAAADYNRTASSTSPLNAGGGTSIARSGYAIANARVGLRQDNWELAVNVRNLGNERPNLGDIGYNGYAQFGTGAFAGGLIPVVATMPPLTALVEFTYRH
jgi:iron complex outermembrane recepter protein